MTHKLTIPGRLPGLNEYITAERTNKYQAAQMKKRAEDTIITLAKENLRKPIKIPVIIHYRWYEKSRRRDKDNISGYGRKLVQDALVKAGKLPGDGWKHICGFSDEFEVDKQNPRVEVEIVEV